MRSLVILAALVFSGAAFGQYCPNGRCPLTRQVVVQDYNFSIQPSTSYRDTIQYHWQSPNRHWTHPNTIQTHISSTHGINPSGMSGEQLLSLHDQIHEAERRGLPKPTRPRQQVAVTRTIQSLPEKPRVVAQRLVDSAPF